MKVVITAFVLTMALCAAIAWVGGFEFDHRSPSVAAGLFFSLYISGVAAYLSYLLFSKEK